MRAAGEVGELHMIVLEALGELVGVFGGSGIGQEGRKSTKRFTCQRFGSSQESVKSPTLVPEMLQDGLGDVPESLAFAFLILNV